ncbi:WecB/TagA/CpsF family glycosyltransferase [Candidatus Gracilibacteria bacterium]|nr:WecB/TagA/CpsF family glycosyltransferase [Candidatus Gracilibacteria bacterium]
MTPIPLCGINFYKGSYHHCLSELQCNASDKVTTLVVTPNPEMLYEAERNKELHGILQSAEYALPDGAGIFVAYQIERSHLPRIVKYTLLPYWCIRAIVHGHDMKKTYGERITGSRLTRDLLHYAEQKKITVTIIDPIVHGNSHGDKVKKESQASMENALQEQFPGIHLNVIISNTVPTDMPHHGIIFATHGNGKQEKLLAEILQKFPHCGLMVGVGGSIDLITGFRSSAPQFFQRFGGEWLYRLYKNPRKHIARMSKVLSFLHYCLQK